MKTRALIAGTLVGGLLTFGGGVVNAEANSPINLGQCLKAGTPAAGVVHPVTIDANGGIHVPQAGNENNGENRSKVACDVDGNEF